MKIAGMLLIVVGLIALAWQGFSYTTSEKVLDAGPIEVSKESTKRVPLNPIVGVGALIAGIALVGFGSKR